MFAPTETSCLRNTPDERVSSPAPAPLLTSDDHEQLIGLATLARMAFAGTDLEPVKTHLLDRVRRNENDANAFMDLSTVLQLMGQRQIGLSMQALALDIQQLYRLRYSADSPGIRLLAILSPGDLSENNALEFLIEGSDITLDMLYVSPDLPFPAALPDHDLAMVAVAKLGCPRRLWLSISSPCIVSRVPVIPLESACLPSSVPGTWRRIMHWSS